ncbi:type I phosphomannose isomerase catalytic subunit [Oscillospiraceae bacterium PP1C4]
MQPFKLSPIYKDYLWGGTNLKTKYHKQSELEKIAESWELACHKDGSCTIDSGEFKGLTLSDFLLKYPDALGERAKEFAYFPIMFKLIDAKDNLSIQVHPDDDYALKVEGGYGKTEMWYVLECEEGAQLVYGLNRKVEKEELRSKIADQSILDLLNYVNVKKGDCFFVNSGTIHAIGKGIVIAEIQQNSNTTYRVYDFDRIDKDGNKRPLHIDKAIEVANTDKMINTVSSMCQELHDGNRIKELANCDYFKVCSIELKHTLKFSADKKSFHCIFCSEGNAELKCETSTIKLEKGDTVFVPALVEYELSGDAELLSFKV